MKNPKLIFLDFDGVLNDPYWLSKVWPLRITRGIKFEFDLSRIENLHRICDQTNAKLVLASSWNFFEGVKEYFETLGFEVVGQLGAYSHRGKAIKGWFKEHPEYATSSYAILDDENSYYDEEQLGHLVFTGTHMFGHWTQANIPIASYLIGLDGAKVDETIRILGGE